MPVISTIENRTRTEVPDDLLASMRKWNGQYSNACDVQHLIWLDMQMAVGTFGEGSMGCYEWFVWRAGKLETSQLGYGNPASALRDVLNQEWPAAERCFPRPETGDTQL